MSQVIERARLYHCAGRSDKVYEIELIAEGNGLFHVVGYNGRRGAQLVAQPKTKRAVPYSTARRIFDQLEQAKLNHRRTPYHLSERQTFPTENSPSLLRQTPLVISPAVAVKVPAAYQASHLDALEL